MFAANAHLQVRPRGASLRRGHLHQLANACLVDLAAQWRIGEGGYESRSANCAFAGREVQGRTLLTIAAGVVAYRERAFAVSAA